MSHGETRTLEVQGTATMVPTGPPQPVRNPSWETEIEDDWVSIPDSPWSTGISSAYHSIQRIDISRSFWLPKEELPAGEYLLSWPRLWIRGLLKGFNDYNAYSSVKTHLWLQQTLLPPTASITPLPFTYPTKKVLLMDVEAGEIETRYHTLPWRNGRSAEDFDFDIRVWGQAPVAINRTVDLHIGLRVRFWTEILGWGDIQLSSYRYRFMNFRGPVTPFGFGLPDFEVQGAS